MAKDRIFQGERMKALRNRLGISQKELAAAVGISRVQITNIEIGGSEPSLPTLIAIALRLNVTTDFLLGVAERKFSQDEPSYLPFD